MTESIYRYSTRTLNGKPLALSDFRDRVLLVVNTASECGFTPQYAGLEKLWRNYGDKGLTIIGFPCNQFGHQEPGNEAAIGTFCETRYGVTFPMSEKVEVNGAKAHPLFHYLTKTLPGTLGLRAVKWNFTKFLVDRHGEPVKRYSPSTPPERIADIELLLRLE
jgi:glutathione peroxidase